MKNRPRKQTAHSRQHTAQGFSLIELLIAAVILALTATLLIGGLMSANRSAELRADRALLAQQLASQLALLPEALPMDAPPQAPCPEPGDASCTVELTDGPLPGLKRVTVSLAHQGHTLHAVTLRPVQEAQP